uniref:Uncharacterized protein n=1 Tax=Triticum urartu TaxID=4572 RepID=A0A8R7UFV6_TRIUA
MPPLYAWIQSCRGSPKMKEHRAELSAPGGENLGRS